MSVETRISVDPLPKPETRISLAPLPKEEECEQSILQRAWVWYRSRWFVLFLLTIIGVLLLLLFDTQSELRKQREFRNRLVKWLLSVETKGLNHKERVDKIREILGEQDK